VAEAAFMIMNTGGRDAVIGKMTVRGQTCVWSKVYYAVAEGSIPKDLPYIATLNDEDANAIDGVDYTFTQASTDLTLQSGKTLIVYISTPDSISVNDIGLTVSINIFTSQAMYYKETNVQGTGGAATGSDTPSDEDSTLEILSTDVYYSTSGGGTSLVFFTVENVNSSSIVITKDDLIVRGTQVSAVKLDVQANGEVTPVTMDSTTIEPGDHVLLLFWGDGTHISRSDIGKPISVGLNLGDGPSVTAQVTVVSAG
jgi:hypothetical protein